MKDLVLVRGGGDIATGVIQKLYRSGFKTLVLEHHTPTSIRRTVSLSEAVYDKTASVEDLNAVLVSNLIEAQAIISKGKIPVLVDKEALTTRSFKPMAVIDAIIAKRNTGTNKDMSDITIALGPGFTAGVDVDIVVETMRGHNLGRLIFDGEAEPNTGIPGEIAGFSKQRVLHSPKYGEIKLVKQIGDIVEVDETILYVGDTPVKTEIKGVLRGAIRNGILVKKGMKIADVDPRVTTDYKTISDKARTIGGAALEALLYLSHKL